MRLPANVTGSAVGTAGVTLSCRLVLQITRISVMTKDKVVTRSLWDLSDRFCCTYLTGVVLSARAFSPEDGTASETLRQVKQKEVDLQSENK